MGLVQQIIILIVLLVFSGFFSGSEVALVSLPKARVKHMVSKKKIGARFIERLKENPQRMLATILIGNNLVNVGASALMTSIVIGLVGSYAIGVATGIMTLLILVFGEITPKSIAAQHNEIVSQFVAFPIWYLSIFLAPILNLLDTFLNKFMKLLGIKAKQRAVTEEEIRSMITMAEEEGAIKGTEKDLLHNIFEFDDINVGEIVTPRTDMVMMNSKATINDALKLILKKKFSRIPVFEKHRDHVVGIVYLKDLLRYGQEEKRSALISKIMDQPHFVPNSMKISKLLRQFQKRKEHMAIVVDEHGSVTGLVTLEDVLEEIVGEISDETDELILSVQKMGENTWLVDGKTNIDEINKKLGMKLKKGDYDTFSGFIVNLMGKIPEKGDKAAYNNFNLKVEEVENNRISKVKIEKI